MILKDIQEMSGGALKMTIEKIREDNLFEKLYKERKKVGPSHRGNNPGNSANGNSYNQSGGHQGGHRHRGGGGHQGGGGHRQFNKNNNQGNFRRRRDQ